MGERGMTTTVRNYRHIEVRPVAGALGDARPPSPPPASWAFSPANGVAIWSIRMAPGASWTLPAASSDVLRGLYFFSGPSLKVDGNALGSRTVAIVEPSRALALQAGDAECEVLLLQGKPIQEPVAQHGPFVMNNRAELQQAFMDYQRTQFGGWPWKRDDPVHEREEARFARHADGRIERHPWQK